MKARHIIAGMIILLLVLAGAYIFFINPPGSESETNIIKDTIKGLTEFVYSIYDEYLGIGSTATVHATAWKGQNFNVTQGDFTFGLIEFNAYRINLPDICYVHMSSNQINPSLNLISNGSFNGSELTENVAGEIFNVTMGNVTLSHN